MAKVSTYLNFPGNTEEAFNFYKSVFGTEFRGEISRMGEIPPQEGHPPIAEEYKNKIMNIALPILGGHILMGTDAVPGMGFELKMGNNIYITLEPDTRAEADRLFNALSEGGQAEMPMQEMFWGDYYGSCTDKFGVGWMIDTAAKE